MALALALAPLAAKPKARPKAKAASKAQPTKGSLQLRSAQAVVVDQTTGQILVDKQGEAVVPIASLTKLMTAMVVLDGSQELSEPLRIEKADVDTLRHSKSRLPVGTVLTRGEALKLALVASENRAAHALARTYPGGVEACVSAMNAKAKALDLQHARFEDPTGLDGGNVASAKDLARMVDAAYAYPLIRQDSTTPKAEVGSGRRRIEFLNTNGLTRNPSWEIGLSKTGYIEEAGKCLAMQVQLGGRPLILVLLDSWGRYTRLGDAARVRKWVESGALASALGAGR
jgi:D-alanyl-D-alanine endopeptidase (penicillin-binding protein 7)